MGTVYYIGLYIELAYTVGLILGPIPGIVLIYRTVICIGVYGYIDVYIKDLL